MRADVSEVRAGRGVAWRYRFRGQVEMDALEVAPGDVKAEQERYGEAGAAAEQAEEENDFIDLAVEEHAYR